MFVNAALRNARLARQARCLSTTFQGALLPRAEVEARVLAVLKSMPAVPPTVSANATFSSDLELDSLHRKELVEKLGREFCVAVPAEVGNGFVSVQTAVDFFAKHPKAKPAPPSF
eukprot:gene36877-44738_t